MSESINLSQFPITPFLDEICVNLKNSQSRFLILTAETAAGKSTVLPLALLKNFSGKILMTEPRRIAVLGVAGRLSELEKEGALGLNADENQIGYKIHLESNITRSTRLEVVTEAILVRQVQSDPALEDYNVVVLDEFHERSVNTDLALAFLKEAMQLRDDLFVVIMSATIDTKKLQRWLSFENVEVPIYSVPGRQYPVKVIYEPEKNIVSAVRDAIRYAVGLAGSNNVKGNILVFLPGIADIRKAQEALLETRDFDEDSDTELCVLHSSVSIEEQKRIIKPPRDGEKVKRRVILSSAIAETSLTVPGVTVVIDSGLARINRIDLNTGMEKLCTETESDFSAEQRKGRAGRLCEGTCIRLWDEHEPRAKELLPEILRADLVPVVLECCERGVYSVDGIDWLDSPSKAAWKTSCKLLNQLGLIRDDYHITEKGKAALSLGIHPRLASIALEAFDQNTKKISAEGRDLLKRFSNYSSSSAELQSRFITDLERRLSTRKFSEAGSTLQRSDFLILSGYPDRLAKRQSEIGVEPAEYQFAGGRQARLYSSRAPLWLVAPEVMAKNSDAVIFDFAELPEAEIEEFLEKNSEIREICTFANGSLQKYQQKCFGEIVLSSKKIPTGPEDYAEAWVNQIAEKGLECLPIDSKIENLLLRAEFIEQQNNGSASASDLSSRLAETAREWLIPFMGGITSLSSQIVYDALYWYLNGSEIDRLAPEQLVLENGRRCKVKYEKQAEIRPIIEIIIQRIFGCFSTPQICGKKVLLRLLSPASRPLQVTEDLEHFWTGAWPEICKEMKGRYPKHNWDYKVVE